MTTAKKEVVKKDAIQIKAPNIQTVVFKIRSTAPYVQHKFSHKITIEMLQKQMEGPSAKNKKIRKARDPEKEYRDAMHLTSKGKQGMPAAGFRSAMISACRLVGFQMTKAKLSVFIEADDFDIDEGSPLVLFSGKPEINKSPVRLETGVASIAIRPMWREWSAKLRVRFDADQFSITDVTNLLSRAGLQVGIGEGRPDSKKSHGMGWGTFEIVN